MGVVILTRTSFPPGWTEYQCAKYWYEELNTHADFRGELLGLFDRLDELLGAKPPRYGAPLDLIGGGAISEARREAWRWIQAFAERWYLPSGTGGGDVCHSYRTRRWPYYAASADKIRTGGAHVQAVPADFRGIDSRIIPPALGDFDYDPLEHDEDWLEQRIEAVCREMRQSIRSQAEQIKRAAAAGDEWSPPRSHQDPAQLRRNAGLLYVYLFGSPASRTLGGIALKTDLSKAAVQGRVRTFTKNLGHVLPERGPNMGMVSS